MHKTRAIKVWADVDVGIASMVLYLNSISGVRTLASCQGSIGEGGASPYRPYVMVSWSRDEIFERLASEFDVSEVGDHHCHLHPKN
jgi:hypothetical protein